MSTNPNSYYDQSEAAKTEKTAEQASFDANQKIQQILDKADEMFGRAGLAIGEGLGQYVGGKVSEHLRPAFVALMKDLDGIIATTSKMNVTKEDNMVAIADEFMKDSNVA